MDDKLPIFRRFVHATMDAERWRPLRSYLEPLTDLSNSRVDWTWRRRSHMKPAKSMLIT